MAIAPQARARRQTRAIGLMIVIAVALGAAAALLAAPAAPGGYVPPTAQPVLGASAYGILGWAILGLVALWLGYEVYKRVVHGRMPIPGRVASAFLGALLVMLVFVLVVRFVVPGHPGGPAQTPTNHTGTPGKTINNSTTKPILGPINGTSPPEQFPAWLVYLGLIGAAAVAALFVVPYFLFRSPKGLTPGGDAVSPTAALSDLERAIAALRSSGPSDARAVIIALYAQLLQRAGRGLGDLEPLTPREIEWNIGSRLRLPVANLRELTALFEEARYSTHELPASYAERARSAIGRALEEIARPTPVDL